MHRSFPNASRAWLAVSAAAMLAACSQSLTPTAGPDTQALSAQAKTPDLGPNVRIFDPSMPLADIQAAVDAVAQQQVPNQFGIQRVALLFKPGTYGTPEHPLIVQVGYYTEVAGLGALPGDVTINGHVDVYNQCDSSGCLALNNFWRSLSNLTINVTGLSDCRSSGDFWAVSQAAPMRRVNIVGGNLTLMDYCTAGPQYASGGFMADTRVADPAKPGAVIINGSQQQFLVRNSTINPNGWTNGVWNQVFAGVDNAPAQSFGQTGAQPYTTLATNPVSREKPFLTTDAQGRLRVFLPKAQQGGHGVTWANGQTPGRSIPLRDFYIAKPGDSVRDINRALAQGMDLLLTPGVYSLDASIRIRQHETVVLGLGLATLEPQNGVVPMTVDNGLEGVVIAGLMFDAGPVNSPVLLQVGSRPDRRDYGWSSNAKNPTTLSDLFFRIGGAHLGRATTSLEVNNDDVLLDDIWAWRADHGEGVGWTQNTADHGVVVNGDRVTATGLFVEHYQKDNVIWNGEHGQTIFFQNELPYDPPNQAAWQHDGVLGYAAYKVADTVKTHEGWGMGSYIFTNVDPSIHASHGFEVPVTPGVQLHDLLTVNLSKGTIDHVVNDTGAAATMDHVGQPVNVVQFP